MRILEQRRAAWLQRVLHKTPQQRDASLWAGLMRRMININPRTHTSHSHIGRNDPCPCGKVYPGVWRRDKYGNMLKGPDGEFLEKPVKLKYCCLSKFIREAVA